MKFIVYVSLLLLTIQGGLWENINNLYSEQSYNKLQSYLENLAGSIKSYNAALLVQKAATTWTKPSYVGLVARMLSDIVAMKPALFHQVLYTIIGSNPEERASKILSPFVRGHEELIEPLKFLKTYLEVMSTAKTSYCPKQESRNCGAFQENFTWTLKTFPNSFGPLMTWLIEWADELHEEELPGFKLKAAFIRMYPMAFFLSRIDDMMEIVNDPRLTKITSESYSKFDLKEKMEVTEYYLSQFHQFEGTMAMTSDRRYSLKWLVETMIIPDTDACDAAVKILIKSDSYRTLSLIWQFNRCSITKNVITAIEDNCPLTFAAFLIHGGNAVKRHQLRSHELTAASRMMLSIVPKKKSGHLQWDPCKLTNSKLIKYEWIPPTGLSQLTPNSIILLARFLLYAQFGIAFDDTRMDPRNDFGEEADWIELPGIASALLERHCQLIGQKPRYKIFMNKENTFISSSSSETSSSLVKPAASSSSDTSDSTTIDTQTSSTDDFDFSSENTAGSHFDPWIRSDSDNFWDSWDFISPDSMLSNDEVLDPRWRSFSASSRTSFQSGEPSDFTFEDPDDRLVWWHDVLKSLQVTKAKDGGRLSRRKKKPIIRKEISDDIYKPVSSTESGQSISHQRESSFDASSSEPIPSSLSGSRQSVEKENNLPKHKVLLKINHDSEPMDDSDEDNDLYMDEMNDDIQMEDPLSETQSFDIDSENEAMRE